VAYLSFRSLNIFINLSLYFSSYITFDDIRGKICTTSNNNIIVLIDENVSPRKKWTNKVPIYLCINWKYLTIKDDACRLRYWFDLFHIFIIINFVDSNRLALTMTCYKNSFSEFIPGSSLSLLINQQRFWNWLSMLKAGGSGVGCGVDCSLHGRKNSWRNYKNWLLVW
jgi:hypothetical protein